jgi:outer membrane lipoprotein carrier protein
VQTKHLALLTEPIVSKGRLAFERPDRLSWQIDSPEPARIVMSGGKLSIPGLSGATRNAIEGTAAQMLGWLGATFSGDLARLGDGFETAAADNGRGISVTLTPRRNDIQAVRTMELRFDEPDLHLADIRITNTLGDLLDLALSGVERNPEIPASEFAIDGEDGGREPSPVEP